jgi:hypothetical protein
MYNIDRYTKAVLTVIALALVTLCIQNLARPAGARAASNEVYIAGYTYDTEVNYKKEHSIIPLGTFIGAKPGLPVIEKK